jgi:DNA-directed RNA polymerase subunit M/transcription elongation factor TFIIS
MERELARTQIKDTLKRHEEYNQLDNKSKRDLIRRLESGCYNQTLREITGTLIPKKWGTPFTYLYSVYIGKIVTYMSMTPCTMLTEILSGDVNARNATSLSPHMLYPAGWQLIVDLIAERRRQIITKRYSSQYLCGMCNGRKTTEVEIQVRSGDEGSTIFITCEMDECNNKWSINT